MENAPTDNAAAQILLITFEKAHEQEIVENKKHCILATLIRLTLETAHHLLGSQSKRSDTPSSPFQQYPFLHQIFFESKAIRQVSDEFGLTSKELGKLIRAELKAIREANYEAVHR